MNSLISLVIKNDMRNTSISSEKIFNEMLSSLSRYSLENIRSHSYKNIYLGELQSFEEMSNNKIINDTKRRWEILLNGVIDNSNYLERVLSVKKQGSMTDLISSCFELYGSDALLMLDGRFSIIGYDRLSGCLVIARDRSGQKPLYYFDNKNI